MKNVPKNCVLRTSDSKIKFEEKGRKIVFNNPLRTEYKKVDVDGCAICVGIRCDKLLTTADEREERYVELKGIDVMHAINQLEGSIIQLGEFDDKRHSYVVCSNVSPVLNSAIQKKKLYFKNTFKSDLIIKERTIEVFL